MKKYNKKIALILALALTLAIALPALAVETNISGSYVGPSGVQEINVVVSGGSNVKAFLNPGGYDADVYSSAMDVMIAQRVAQANEEREEEEEPIVPGTKRYEEIVEEVKDACLLDTITASGDITTMPIVGVNLGASPIKVKATVNSAVSGKFAFASSAPSQNSNSGLVFLEVKALDSSYDFNYDSTPLWQREDGMENRYDAFDGHEILDALNKWHTTWTDPKDSNEATKNHTDWINLSIFPQTVDSSKYESTSDKAYKDAVKEAKDKAAANKKIFTSAFSELKKQGQLINKDNKALGYKDEIVVLKKGTSASKQQVCTMKSGKDAPTYFIARLSGKLGQGDQDKKKWAGSDGFSASIIWTFETAD